MPEMLNPVQPASLETQADRAVLKARGVGPITSLAFVLNLDNDPRRLRRSRDAGARMGLRPKRRQFERTIPGVEHYQNRRSDVATHVGAVCTLHAGSLGRGLDAEALGFAAGRPRGHSAKRKAVVAVARKLAVLHVLWQDVDFDPFYGLKPQPKTT